MDAPNVGRAGNVVKSGAQPERSGILSGAKAERNGVKSGAKRSRLRRIRDCANGSALGSAENTLAGTRFEPWRL
jgi:hypothetical protein